MAYYAETGRSRPPNRLTLHISFIVYPFLLLHLIAHASISLIQV